ncbi:hypothetical protein KEJ36_01085 [Candidatus Bathyarchaeota archaeon]|nr:hypothetical protein [Candidatus Bathyarchaeota archaeon]MBS7627417.1 hypothetical protein [Candidatus Bathyarchaeota archaeon]
MNLYKLGAPLHISKEGNIVVKALNIPGIGDEVVDAKMNPIGIVADIIGPTRSPYVLVKPTIKKTEEFLKKGGSLYALAPRRRMRFR